MPETAVVYYCDERGNAPVLAWLKKLSRTNRKAAEKCATRIETLRQLGHELRRPIADYLRDGVYELRIREARSNCRILYSFHGQGTVILLHGLVKEKEIPPIDIERAIERRARFEKLPQKHTYREG